ncbi:unnamed protein product [Spodoptera littoralis]|uniref:Calcitonin receptor n=1 Tax=Spodoptera littoralis TaxID=7109 RepID=A0A9P0IK07_SPOLI|nr:unnamed protein product [Spodoptera littoralis]CAH1647194.1 unnamed protein product [Spodoptera littoralis]
MEIMQERHLMFSLFYYITWISILRGTQVGAHLKDVLNPVNTEFDVWHQRDARVAIRSNEHLACERPNIYICEEPPETVPPDARKTCNYRNVRYHEQVFRWVAGRGCLLYTPDFLYVGGVNNFNLNAGCFYGNWFAPCLEIAKEDGSCGCYPFDPGLEEVAAAVHDALIPSAQGRWERCFYAATDCCSHYMPENLNTTTNCNKCEPTFDGWTCWPEADIGTVATEVCSEFAYSNSGPSCHHYSSKQCHRNGSWELQTDYSTCSITPRLVRRYQYYIIVLSISIAACLPAVFIFCFYKRLRIPRVVLHRNLLIAIVIRNALVIVSRSEIYIDELTSSGETVMSTHGVACRILAFAERVAGNAVFVCMLVEGIYLHRSIVAVFKQKLKIKWLYGAGAVIALTPAISWAAVMAVHNDHSCWLVYTVPHIQWILDVPRIAILLINTILFIDILRVLLTKIRNSENANQLSTAKATLFLMPLFGTQFLLTAFRPSTSNCIEEQIYYYVSYTLEGLQGLIVAMIYCYINTEVRGLIKATYRKTESAVVSRIRRDSSFPRMSQSSDRRITCSTGLPSNAAEESKDQYATIRPKLHVAEIISIQASERLAEILEPVYETIQNGVTNEGYDSLDRSDLDNDSGFIANRDFKVEDYYGFTNASSVSIDCQDWIRCVSSPSSSVYNNSLNDYETKYLEKKFPNHSKLRGICEVREKNSDQIIANWNCMEYAAAQSQPSSEDVKKEIGREREPVASAGVAKPVDDGDYDDCENMFEEIMQYIETTDNHNTNTNTKVTLDPNCLAPNRRDGDRIVFLDE